MTDVIEARKLTDLKAVVEDNELEVRGDKSLLDKERVEHFPQHEIDMWTRELESMYSHLPKNLIGHIVDLYNTNPDIFNQVCEEAKKNPEMLKPKKQEPLRFPEGSDTIEIKTVLEPEPEVAEQEPEVAESTD